MEEPTSSAESSLSGSVIKCKASQSRQDGEPGEYVITSPTEFDIVQSTVREVQNRRQRSGGEAQVRENPEEESGDEFMLLWRSTRNEKQDRPATDDSTTREGEQVAECEGVCTSDVMMKDPGSCENQEEKDGRNKEEMDYLRLASVQSPEQTSECLPESSGSSVRSWVSSDLSSLDDEMTSARMVKERRKVEGTSEGEAMESVYEEESSKEAMGPTSSTVVRTSSHEDESGFHTKHVSVSTEKDGDKIITRVITRETSREVTKFEYCAQEETPDNDVVLAESDIEETKPEVREVTNLETRTELGKVLYVGEE